jgi:hypothetical protein
LAKRDRITAFANLSNRRRPFFSVFNFHKIKYTPERCKRPYCRIFSRSSTDHGFESAGNRDGASNGRGNVGYNLAGMTQVGFIDF